MAGPWEKFQAQQPGPWTKFQAVRNEEIDQGQQVNTAAKDDLNPQSGRGSLADKLLQGLTLGYGDEAMAAAMAPVRYLGSRVQGKPQSLSEAYDEGLEAERGRLRDVERRHPIASTAAELAGGVGSGVGLARSGLTLAGRATGILPRLGAAAAEGAGYGALYGFGTGEGDNRLQNAGMGALVGLGTGPAFEGASRVYQGVRRAMQPRPQTTGISASAPRNADPDAIARAAAAEEFGIPLTRGQATGDVAQQAFEEAARNEARGARAGNIMRQFGDRQHEAIAAAQEDIAKRIGGGQKHIENALEVGTTLPAAVQSRAQALRSQGQQAYEAALETGNPAISVDAIQAAPTRIAQQIEQSAFVVDPALTPSASKAMEFIGELGSLKGAPAGDALAVSLKGIEQTRKKLVNLKPTNAQDAAVLRQVKGAFDDWLDDAVDNSLFSGDPKAIEELKRARALWAQYRSITTAKKGDDAGRIIAKMADPERDVQPAEVANWLYGASKVGNRGVSVRVAERLKSILGETSPEWAQIRQGAFLRAVQSAEGKPGKGPQALANSLFEFVNGEGSQLARKLYTPEEVGLINRYASVLKNLVPDPQATNPSKTSYGNARLLGDVFSNLAGLLGFAHGGIEGGLLGKFGIAALTEGKNLAKALLSVNKPIPAIPDKGIAGVAAGSGIASSDLANSY